MKKIISISVFSLVTFIQAPSIAKLPEKDLSKTPPNVVRTCCAFGYDLSIGHIPFLKRTDITSITRLGEHVYLGANTEGNGIVYTQKGGFIDIGHLRDYVDWSAFLYATIEKIEPGESFQLDLGHEGGSKQLDITIPHDATNDFRLDLTKSIAYNLSLWHEIATWFGTSYIPLIPEGYSTFSPEDLYSNLLGVEIGILAIQSDDDFETAVTKILNQKLEELGVVKTELETYEAMASVEGNWWTHDKALPSGKILLKRFYDSPEQLTPWTIVDSIDAVINLKKPAESLKENYVFSIIPGKKLSLTNLAEITEEDFDHLITLIKIEQDKFDQKEFAKRQKNEAKKKLKLEKEALVLSEF